MKEIVEKKRCTGCSACASICPKGAIKLVEDNEGFKHPVIDQDKCINCGLCKRTCPVLNTKDNGSLNKCYVAYNKNDEVKKTSSSGGIFDAIANNSDIADLQVISVEDFKQRKMVIDTDLGQGIKELITDLEDLLEMYKQGLLREKLTDEKGNPFIQILSVNPIESI